MPCPFCDTVEPKTGGRPLGHCVVLPERTGRFSRVFCKRCTRTYRAKLRPGPDGGRVAMNAKPVENLVGRPCGGSVMPLHPPKKHERKSKRR
jgi:hypothetical protein